MTSMNVQTALKSMVAAVGTEASQQKGGRDYPVVVTISRDSGTHGDTIALKLAEKLGVELYDHVFVERIAERLDTDHKLVKALDEGVGRARDMWLYRLMTGVDITPGTYRRHLVNVILSLAQMGGVIVGRGAHVVLNTGAALRVRLTGSEDGCAARVAEKKGIDLKTAHKEIEAVDHNRAKFVWDMFKSRLNDPKNFDIVINTDRLTNIDELVETLAQAVHAIHASLKDDEKNE